jgi:hypothetical protein
MTSFATLDTNEKPARIPFKFRNIYKFRKFKKGIQTQKDFERELMDPTINVNTIAQAESGSSELAYQLVLKAIEKEWGYPQEYFEDGPLSYDENGNETNRNYQPADRYESPAQGEAEPEKEAERSYYYRPRYRLAATNMFWSLEHIEAVLKVVEKKAIKPELKELLLDLCSGRHRFFVRDGQTLVDARPGGPDPGGAE